jgi:hypothetical protein
VYVKRVCNLPLTRRKKYSIIEALLDFDFAYSCNCELSDKKVSAFLPRPIKFIRGRLWAFKKKGGKMQDIFKKYDAENNKRILSLLYNHNLCLGENLTYNNYLVDINGNQLGLLFTVCKWDDKIFPEGRRKNFSGLGEIYKIENTLNHKKYIGKSIDIIARKSKHVYDLYTGNHDSSDMQMDFYLYSMSNFTFEIIQTVKGPEKLNDREKYWIKEYNSQFPNGYNAPSKRNSPEYKNRISSYFLVDYSISKTKKEKDDLVKLAISGKYIPEMEETDD